MFCKGSTEPKMKCSVAINGRRPSACLLHLSLTVAQVCTPEVIYCGGGSGDGSGGGSWGDLQTARLDGLLMKLSERS